MYEKTLLTDTALQTAALFGNFDCNITVIEKAFGVSVVNRDTEKTAGDAVVIRGEDSDAVARRLYGARISEKHGGNGQRNLGAKRRIRRLHGEKRRAARAFRR